MSVVLKGDNVMAVLQGLPRQFTEPYLQRVHTKAVVPLVNKIHLNAPVGLTGRLADSIGVVKAGKNNVDELGLIHVGPRTKGGYKGFAGHMNEYGTKKRVTRKGANRGRMIAKPFEAPSWEQTKDEVERNIAKELERDLGGFINRTL